MISYFLYTLSFVPFGLKILKKTCACLFTDWLALYLQTKLTHKLNNLDELTNIIAEIIYESVCFWIAKGLRNRSHHLPIHFGDSSKDASQCSILVQVICNHVEFTDISCSPFGRILPNLLKDFREPKSYLRLQQSRLVMKWRFDIELFFWLLQFQVENHTNKHFLHDHRVKLQASPFLQQSPLQWFSIFLFLAHIQNQLLRLKIWLHLGKDDRHSDKLVYRGHHLHFWLWRSQQLRLIHRESLKSHIEVLK